MQRRNNGDGCIRQRQDGRWEAKLVIEGKTKSFYGKTKAEVKKKLAQIQADLTNEEYLDETNMTVNQWLDEWLKNFVDVKASTFKRYELDVRLRFKPTIGRIKLKDLSALDIQRAYKKFLNQGLAPKSITNAHGTLHEALRKAVKMGFIKRNVSEDVDLPKVRQEEMHPLKDDEVMEFLEAAKPDRFYDVYFTAIFTGMRQSELVGLTWDSVDFKRGTIRVYRQYVDTKDHEKGRKRVCKFTTTKNDKTRIVEPAPQVIDLLRDVKAKQEAMAVAAGEKWENTDAFVFTNKDGSPINVHTLYNHFKEIIRSIGLDDVRFHDLRHTFATLAIQNGTDIKTVSSTLGHATVAFTMDKYGHVSDTMRHDAARRMSFLISAMDKVKAEMEGGKAG